MKPLVSIVTPVYNGELTIKNTIESVLNQTMKNFEMLIVDDQSNDNTIKIIKEYQRKDSRIKLFILDKKGGACGARNFATTKAKGRYIAFLDADDIWKKEKLEKQINFMTDNNIAFSYSDYSFIDDNNKDLGIYRKCPNKMTYFRMLLGNSIGCLTAIYDSKVVGKVRIPELKKRNDYAIWCKVLKKCKVGYKYNDILAYYRKNNKSLSSGKKYKLLKYHYQLHHKINKLNPILSLFFTISNIIVFFNNKYIRDKKMSNYYIGELKYEK